MSSSEDLESLAREARSGSSEAWGEIYEGLAPSIYRLCRRVLQSREDAEDAANEIFLKARIRLVQYDATRPFRPWFLRVAANHCLDELRKRRTHAEIDDPQLELERVEEASPTPEQAVLVNESKRNVRKAMSVLDDRSRMALVLRYFADMSYAEIGEVLGISTTFVGVLLTRARRQLRSEVAR
jgi:RNA polymerase sigma-70 factor (ECF subfamily)